MMNWEKLARELVQETESKIILLVLDGLGDLPLEGRTPLEAAHKPNLDQLAAKSVCGLTDPIFRGITPGSGPSHLALFGYDPLKYILGRGILEALGLGVEVRGEDLVARGNFATLKDGLIVDRRAGRISSIENEKLCARLNESLRKRKGVGITLFPGKEHRFVARFRGKNLSDSLSDADPQKEKNPLTYTEPLHEEARETAVLINRFIDEVTEILKDSPKANTILLRGFSKLPSLPTFSELYALKAAAIASYPMYKGLARLLGMEVVEANESLEELFLALENNYQKYNFFYLHVKKTDTAGEDGNFEAKKKAIEEVDEFIPRLVALKPEVLVITSDHSTPCLLKSHSWHPNPLLLFSRTCIPDEVEIFTERGCSRGYLGRFEAIYLMPLILAHAGKLKKFGA